MKKKGKWKTPKTCLYQPIPECLWQHYITFPSWWSLFQAEAPELDLGSPLCSLWGPHLLLRGLSPLHPDSCQWQRIRITIPKNNNNNPFTNNGLFGCSVLPSLAHADDPQLFAVFVLDPLDALQLRIHHERPALAGSQDGGILRRHPVGGQPFVLPRRDICVVCQHGQGVQVWCRGNRDLAGETNSGFTTTGSKCPFGFIYV